MFFRFSVCVLSVFLRSPSNVPLVFRLCSVGVPPSAGAEGRVATNERAAATDRSCDNGRVVVNGRAGGRVCSVCRRCSGGAPAVFAEGRVATNERAATTDRSCDNGRVVVNGRAGAALAAAIALLGAKHSLYFRLHAATYVLGGGGANFVWLRSVQGQF